MVDYQDLAILTDNWLISNYQVTPTAPTDANLVAYYRFEGNFDDSSSNGNDGEPNGATIVTDPIRGQVASFDGVDDCVNTNKTLLDNLSAFTLAGWVIAGNPQDSRTGLFGQNDAIEFGFDGGLNIWTSGGGSTSTTWTLGTTTWHHVAAVGDGKGVKLYIDGLQLASGGSATSNYGTSTYAVNIGGGGIWDTSGNWFAGRMDDVRIYNRALSPGEIASLAGKTTSFTQPLYLLLTPQNPGINLYNDGRIDLKDYAVLADVWLEELLWP
jgi:hypothetical protein